jgi:predicted nucleotidyltransferase
MNIVGLIVEYNPLHNGHLYHFQQSLKACEAEASVIVMSGHFLQRGEPSLVNKWARTKMALSMGADLVFELPYAYSTQSAEGFAFGAISILNQLPFVTHLCFGSEGGHVDALDEIASLIYQESDELKQALKRELLKGISYPSAYAKALLSISRNEAYASSFMQPNNMLGISYLVALKHLNSHIIPKSIKREKAGYHDTQLTDQHIASATGIREALFSEKSYQWQRIKPYVPSYTYQILKEEARAGRGPVSWENYFKHIQHALLSQPSHRVASLFEVEEGLENRLRKYIAQAHSFEHFCQLVKSKRYTYNRIQRMMTHLMLNYSKQDRAMLELEKGPSYLRLLGFSKKGRSLLNSYKESLSPSLVAKLKKENPSMLQWDIKSAQVHSLAYKGEQSLLYEYQQSPIQH